MTKKKAGSLLLPSTGISVDNSFENDGTILVDIDADGDLRLEQRHPSEMMYIEASSLQDLVDYLGRQGYKQR